MRPADRSCARLGEAEVQHLPRLDQVSDRTGHVFDGYFGVHPVLVVEVDAVGSKALQRRFDNFLDVLRPG